MPKLIDQNGVVRVGDDWFVYTGDASAIPVGAKVLLPATELREFAGTWRKHASALGVLLSPSDDPATIAHEFANLELIAVEFPAFTDGRGYSKARLLRERYGWQGELRAVGDIQRDQLFLLKRAGFDMFALREDQDVAIARDAFADFSVAYQPCADRLNVSGGLRLAA
jgi:uncharacterized protein (DUF934 family)